MKHVLFLSVVVAVFVPVLASKLKATRALFNKLITERQTAAQKEIVDVHNDFRRKVIPPAKNMLKMSWSPAAAQNARILAQYCDMARSNSLERRLNNTFCGENMYSNTYPTSWSQVIRTWYNESKDFKYGEWPFKDEDVETKHYTQIHTFEYKWYVLRIQEYFTPYICNYIVYDTKVPENTDRLVWATSYLIGCDVAWCRRGKIAKFLYVCHYCHEGNDPDTENEPYQNGPPCGDCPNNCDGGLCTNPCLYYNEYHNCERQVKIPGCTHPNVQQFCKASCLCKTEIK